MGQTFVNFFNEANEAKESSKLSKKYIEAKVSSIDYDTLLGCVSDLENEFNNIYRALQQDPKNKERFWYYSYYCVLELQKFYRIYQKADKEQQYDEMAKTILKYIDDIENKGTLSVPQKVLQDRAVRKAKERSFIELLKDLMISAFSDIKNSLNGFSKVRNHVEKTNVIRMFYMIARLTLLNLTVVLKNWDGLRRFNETSKLNFDLDVIATRINSLQNVMNGLSVALYALHALINTIMLIKHTVGASEEEKTASVKKRFLYELDKRGLSLMNQAVWGVANLVTNYPGLLGLSNPVVIGITGVGLIFDLTMCMVLWHKKENHFKALREKYNTQITEIQLISKEKRTTEQNENLDMLEKQLYFLEIDQKVMRAEFSVNCSAAILLGVGLTVFFLASNPAIGLASIVLSALALSLYINANQYGKMVHKKELANQADLSDEAKTLALKECQKDKKALIINIAKSTLLPTLFMGVCVVCPQAGLALIVTYALYTIFKIISKVKPDEDNVETSKPDLQSAKMAI